MNNSAGKLGLSSLAAAILTALSSAPAVAQQSEEDKIIEEVVVQASRLKGSASAVIDERKNQAFVADILGADQISRTGDGDAAAALRRVTGLTLVDGKFIYVRGLGERYSSTQLNGATVPSPDPTRTVIPLDLFPAEIIESLSVQKSFSPSMPASFGGGNVDIRLKTIPSDFVLTVSSSIGGNSENFDDGIGYTGGDNDWYGKDDGTRGMSPVLASFWDNRVFLNDISSEQNRQVAADLNRDVDVKSKSIGPDVSLDFAIGDSYETGDFRFGFLATTAYDNGWDVAEQYEGQDFRKVEGGWELVRGFDQVTSTEHSVKWSGMLNFGVEYDKNHRIDLSTLILHDTRDELKDKLGNTNNVLLSDGLKVRDVEVIYEERELISNQIKGMHTFPELNFLGFDWKYSSARSNRYAPGNVETRFILADANGDGVFDINTESSLRRGRTASRFNYQDLNDKVENYGFNLSLPLTVGKNEIELKTGADFIEKKRDAQARRFDLNTLAFDNVDLSGSSVSSILTDDIINNSSLNDTILRDTTIAGDDYEAAQKVDAFYVEADVFFDNTWRISGGVRFEDFQQVMAPLIPQDGSLDVVDTTPKYLQDLAVQNDDLFPALAMTYIMDESMQFRLSYGETVVRPDLREVANSTFIDPIFDRPTRGTPSLRATQMKNYDARWEWYMDTGENLSIGLFYKDMIDPIESVQTSGQDGPPLIVMGNAEQGEVYGIEFEFMKDFAFLGGMGNDFFLSGNLTLSDSEITLDRQNLVDQTGVSAAVTNTKRRLSGHSQYVVNMQLGYDSPNGNHSASAVYNVFGERISIAGIEGADDSFEKPFHSLDLVYTYYPSFASTVKVKLQNILNQEKELEFENTLLRSETKGVGFSVSYKYDF